VTPEDTLIWLDAPESAKAAEECIAAFRAIPAIGNKPIVAIVYTMFHADHTWGAGVRMQVGDKTILVLIRILFACSQL
jgi:glyoxylase-like metal-dependent hydrolase (beta-lactamase superfamily II)